MAFHEDWDDLMQEENNKEVIVVWFSCGAASAIAAFWLTLHTIGGL